MSGFASLQQYKLKTIPESQQKESEEKSTKRVSLSEIQEREGDQESQIQSRVGNSQPAMGSM